MQQVLGLLIRFFPVATPTSRASTVQARRISVIQTRAKNRGTSPNKRCGKNSLSFKSRVTPHGLIGAESYWLIIL